jgi:hypothetical protein
VAAELHLIGVMSRDPSGTHWLRTLLTQLRPDVVAVEGSRAGYERARSNRDPALEDATDEIVTTPGHSAATANVVLRLLSPRFAHFEHDAAVRYSTRHKRQLVFLDDEANDEPVPTADPLAPSISAVPDLTLAKLLTLAAHDWNAEFERVYQRARGDLSVGRPFEAAVAPEDHASHARRAAALATVVTRLCQDATNARVAVVCPLSHLYASERSLTLYSTSEVQSTTRYLTDGHGQVSDI